MSPAMNASIPVGSNKKHQGNPYPSVCFALLRVVVTVRDTATRDVDVTVSIDKSTSNVYASSRMYVYECANYTIGKWIMSTPLARFFTMLALRSDCDVVSKLPLSRGCT